MTNRELILKLEKDSHLTKDEFSILLSSYTQSDILFAREKAQQIAKAHFGNKVYMRGLIEFTNICSRNCYYCGLRYGNNNISRYRLSEEEILSCCREGYNLGFRTFVLQGGEDPYFTDDKICSIIEKIKSSFPDCVITLSIGEKSRETYQKYFDAGARRYLLRHETANDKHYSIIHPKEMSLANRKKCLYDLMDIGFQTGCGFMVGSPEQTFETLADDLTFIADLKPHMVGIGPFIPHKDTPFGNEPQGDLDLTLFLLSLVRIMLKTVLLPSTTALGTIHPDGREMGILSGANVVMPNLSPILVREKYMLYNNKISTGEEAAEGVANLKEQMLKIGYKIINSVGNHPDIKQKGR